MCKKPRSKSWYIVTSVEYDVDNSLTPLNTPCEQRLVLANRYTDQWETGAVFSTQAAAVVAWLWIIQSRVHFSSDRLLL